VRKRAVLLAAFFLLAPAAAFPAEDRDVIFQVSTIDALLQGVLEGDADYAAVAARGDFGIGTFNELDGEMLATKGSFFQIKADGRAYPVGKTTKTPFATVTYFDADETFTVSEKLDYESLLARLDEKLPVKNVPYAFRIEGRFEAVKTRSVPKQKKPYPKLEEVVKTQPVFEFHDTEGTLVGFRFPEYMRGLNVPGYHFHFLTADKKSGGHVLSLTTRSVTVEADKSAGLDLRLPGTKAFETADLGVTDGTALLKVEKASAPAGK
jgi:acetolactate decarboxylase